MRALLPVFFLISLSACATGNAAIRATMPLEILRDEGQPPRMGQATVQAGGYGPGDPFYFAIYFDVEAENLGQPTVVAWQMPLGSYCRNQFTSVMSVLTGPAGQVWDGQSLGVPMGPDRGNDVTSGYGDKERPDMLSAAAAGGRFTLALQDHDGHRWGEVLIDVPAARERRKLFAANRAALAAVDPTAVPLNSGLLEVVGRPSFSAPWPPRPCPGS